jgi:hypothetical protein
MRKFGGGITLAKVHNTENVREREVNNIEEVVPEFTARSVPALWDAAPKHRQRGKMKVKLAIKHMNPQSSPKRFGSIAPQLFNLDSSPETEKPLGIKLSLYQMENF